MAGVALGLHWPGSAVGCLDWQKSRVDAHVDRGRRLMPMLLGSELDVWIGRVRTRMLVLAGFTVGYLGWPGLQSDAQIGQDCRRMPSLPQATVGCPDWPGSSSDVQIGCSRTHMPGLAAVAVGCFEWPGSRKLQRWS